MTRKSFFLTTAGFVFIFIFFFSGPSEACGPFFTSYIYAPDEFDRYYPLVGHEAILNSEYGIILSNWGSEYMYPIYSDLINKKFTDKIKGALTSFYEGTYYPRNNIDDAIKQWQEARKLVTSKEKQINAYKYDEDGYYIYANCLSSSFITAAETLEERAKIYNKEEIKEWLDGQDAVFANCGQAEELGFSSDLTAFIGNKSGSFIDFFARIYDFIKGIFAKVFLFFRNIFPGEEKVSKQISAINASELLKYDKEYQQAAAAFYQNNFEEAEELFKKIADNQKSPWRGYSALALARVYIRDQQYDKAIAQLEKILRDNYLSQFHKAAKSSISFVNFRINPKQEMKNNEEVLFASNDSNEIVNNLENFSSLFYRNFHYGFWFWAKDISEDEYNEYFDDYEKYVFKEGGDFSKWLYVWWNPKGADYLNFALQKYEEQKSLPWLLASLKLMTPDNPSRDKIIQDSLKIPEKSSAYFTATYYRLKLFIKMGKKQEVKELIDRLLNTINFEKMPSVKNHLYDLKMQVADNLRDVLSYSMMTVVATDDEDTAVSPVQTDEKFLDKRIKIFFNEYLPMEKWVEIASNNELFPDSVKEQIRYIAFVRAFLLDDIAAAGKMANLLSVNDKTAQRDFADFLRVSNIEEKKFAAALVILDYPRLGNVLNGKIDEAIGIESFKGMDPYNYDWWSCSYENHKDYDLEFVKKFISSQEVEKAQLENKKIYNITFPNYLPDLVINYAIKNQNDPRVPEALHLVVIYNRFAGCKDDETTNFSKKAFQLLHKNYPNNYWTKETPYYY